MTVPQTTSFNLTKNRTKIYDGTPEKKSFNLTLFWQPHVVHMNQKHPIWYKRYQSWQKKIKIWQSLLTNYLHFLSAWRHRWIRLWPWWAGRFPQTYTRGRWPWSSRTFWWPWPRSWRWSWTWAWIMRAWGRPWSMPRWPQRTADYEYLWKLVNDNVVIDCI